MPHTNRTSVGRFWGGLVARRALIACACLAAGCASPCFRSERDANNETASATPADLVILSAKLWTGAESIEPSGHRPNEPQRPRHAPSALAVRNGTIVALGDDDTVRRLVGPDTVVIHTDGRRVIPGITDSHTHIVSGGLQLGRLNLRDVASKEAFIRAVADAANAAEKGTWILGGRWSVESWTDRRSPTRAWLDPVTPDHPVFLSRMDGHQALVNTAALHLAGIDASGPPDPPGGEIERDPVTREPTGILKESAMNLVARRIPPPSLKKLDEALQRAMAHANSLGITSVHDMSTPSEWAVLRRAHERDALTLRVTVYLNVPNWLAFMDEVKRASARDGMLHVAGFKGFMDGSLGSRTAYMREPYDDAPHHAPYPRGQLNEMADPPELFARVIAQADAAGMQLAVHAIGDEANHLLLNAYEAALRASGRQRAGHRIEHAQHLIVEDVPRFARLGVVASMQPFHKADDGRYAEQRLGSDRLRGSYAFRQLVDAGALLIFGSDFPVVTINPFRGIDAAVNARTLAGNLWLVPHSLTVDEAMRAYTVWPPRAIRQGHRRGTIEVGKDADIVILEDDPFSISPERIKDVRVHQTIVAGKVVYRRPG